MKTIRLGVIGLNEGNGHPYSWSAICNGYDKAAMASCPYPVIPAYLGKQRFPDDAIPDARVTHIWTQSRQMSEHVAAASLIATVVDDPRAMIGAVDAILLLRDDAESHLELARPYIAAGMPIYLDKMAAPTIADTNAIFDLQKYPGQVQCGTALRHAPEFRIDEARRKTLGEIVQVHGLVLKDWEHYAIHVVEPAMNALGPQGRIVDRARWQSDGLTNVSLKWQSGMTATFQAVGATAAPIALTLIGTDGYLYMEFEDTFRCFKAALARFIDMVRDGNPPDEREFTLAVMDVVSSANR